MTDFTVNQQLCLAYVRHDVRETLRALFSVERHFAESARLARDSQIARIKLAWWREQGLKMRNDGADLATDLALLDAAGLVAVDIEALLDEQDAWLARDRVDCQPEGGEALTNMVARICGAKSKAARVLAALADLDIRRRGKGWRDASVPRRMLVALFA